MDDESKKNCSTSMDLLKGYTPTPAEIKAVKSAFSLVSWSSIFGFMIPCVSIAYITTKRKWNLAPRIISSTHMSRLIIDSWWEYGLMD